MRVGRSSQEIQEAAKEKGRKRGGGPRGTGHTRKPRADTMLTARSLSLPVSFQMEKLRHREVMAPALWGQSKTISQSCLGLKLDALDTEVEGTDS